MIKPEAEDYKKNQGNIMERIADEIDGGEGCFIVDSKSIEVCKPTRSKRCAMGRGDIGDKGYLRAQVQLDLFETANIRLETPLRSNQKSAKPFPTISRKLRKRIEPNFSRLCAHFLFVRNYAKNVDELFSRIIGKISTFTVLQYINKTNNKPIDRIKYALL